MKKPKIPKAALNDLIDACELLGKLEGKPASEVFKNFLALMEKYEHYFFNEEWPNGYNYDAATTFTPEDKVFLSESQTEFEERLVTVCLKKSIYLGGFMFFGLIWTQEAYDEEFSKPEPESDRNSRIETSTF